MNGTLAPQEDGVNEMMPPPLGYFIFQALFLSIIMIVTILGNVAVCYVVHRTRSITTVTGMCITSLALADLFRGILVLPIVIFASIFGGEWALGDVVCSLSGLWYTLFGTASVMTLAAVSIDRYVAILKPLKYTSIITTARAAFFICLIWLVSILMALLPIMGWSRYGFSPWNGICIANWIEYKPYACFYLSISFLLPFSVLVFCYYNIFKVARHQSRRVMSLEVTSVDGRGSTGLGLNSRLRPGRPDKRPRLVMRKEKKAAMTLFTVMGVFILCVTPYNVVHLAYAFEGSFNLTVALGVTSMLSFVNSAANPLIYGILNRKFRHVFLEVLKCRYCPRCCCGAGAGPDGFQHDDIPSDMPTASMGHRLKPIPRDSGYMTSYTQTTTSTRNCVPDIFAASVTSTSNTLASLGGNMKSIARIAQGQLPMIEDISSDDEELASPGIMKNGRLPQSKIGLRARFVDVTEAPQSSVDNTSDPSDAIPGTSMSKDSGQKSPLDNNDFRLILSPTAL
ncbi:histamine H2 receptor-like [Patiria miniata]|uniref:G-protein coupled receptors family 1 profile domain-containing protein n=1 Tax=Patiria miniata TaxID=46514 RepID=A0A914BD41_PATMI|nr:histamine H2 receptor-like [Patiria miniata]